MKPARHIAPRGAHRQALRQLRILVLLVVLFIVAVGTWRDHARSTQWRVPLFVALYPIAADSSAVTQRYVASLRGAQFADIDAFFATQAHHYGVALPVPLQIRLKDALQVLPPARAAEDGPLKTLLWSLRLRYWAWRQTRAAREPADVRLFVLYHDPAQAATLPHSSGLQKGMIGVVHAFALADMQGSNNVVIAHEIMHTLGAGDKYDAMNDAPLFGTRGLFRAPA